MGEGSRKRHKAGHATYRNSDIKVSFYVPGPGLFQRSEKVPRNMFTIALFIVPNQLPAQLSLFSKIKFLFQGVLQGPRTFMKSLRLVSDHPCLFRQVDAPVSLGLKLIQCISRVKRLKKTNVRKIMGITIARPYIYSR
jgi:hypothetical protein